MESTQSHPIKAIETKYAGCRFRSRLEARWAVVWDRLGIKWEYEPEGYDLPSGYYLPDFFLPGLVADRGGTWFEVKPENLMGTDVDPRWADLCVTTGIPMLIAYGLPRHNEDPKVSVDRFKFITSLGPERLFPGPGGVHVRAAYTAARSARFEHGEVG